MRKYKKLYISHTHCPYENLALENDILMSIPCGESYLFLYRNRPSIIYGRFQNPWLECNVPLAKATGVDFVRRQSGGGCVYHDLGNLNFSFIHGTRDFYKEDNNSFLKEFLLQKLNIPAYLNERSDIRVKYGEGDFKISGSAFKQKKDRSFHHCTLLVESNLSDLDKYLRSKYKTYKTKSLPSNPSHVINIGDINSNIRSEQIEMQLLEFMHLNNSEILSAKNIKDNDYLLKLQSWDEQFGQTPLFEHEVLIDEGKFKLEITKSKITHYTFETSSHSKETSELVSILENLDITPDTLLKLSEASIHNGTLNNFISKLKSDLSL